MDAEKIMSKIEELKETYRSLVYYAVKADDREGAWKWQFAYSLIDDLQREILADKSCTNMDYNQNL